METKKTLPDGLIILIVPFILIFAIGAIFFNGYINEKQAYISKNTSDTGIVVEKTFHTGNFGRFSPISTCFYITVERKSVNFKGEESSIVQKHTITYEEWSKIEIGDEVIYDENDSLTINTSIIEEGG